MRERIVQILHFARHPHSTIQSQNHPVQHDVLDALRNQLCELVRASWSHCLLLAFICLPNATEPSPEVMCKYLRGNSITLVRLARTLSDIIAVILESNKLGAIVTTLMPYLARSRVIGRVSDAIAPFEALYATMTQIIIRI